MSYYKTATRNVPPSEQIQKGVRALRSRSSKIKKHPVLFQSYARKKVSRAGGCVCWVHVWPNLLSVLLGWTQLRTQTHASGELRKSYSKENREMEVERRGAGKGRGNGGERVAGKMQVGRWTNRNSV